MREKLALNEKSRQSLVKEYLYLSQRHNLKNTDEERIEEILMLALDDKRLSSLISEADSLLCEKLSNVDESYYKEQQFKLLESISNTEQPELCKRKLSKLDIDISQRILTLLLEKFQMSEEVFAVSIETHKRWKEQGLSRPMIMLATFRFLLDIARVRITIDIQNTIYDCIPKKERD